MNNALKNTTLRLEADLLELVQKVAHQQECAPSELMRTAIRLHLERLGETDPGAAQIISEFVEARLAEAEAELRKRLGAPDPQLARDRD
jgi:hypothetical protein